MSQLMNACVVAMWRRLKARIAWTLGCRPGNVDSQPCYSLTFFLLISLPYVSSPSKNYTHTHTLINSMRSFDVSRHSYIHNKVQACMVHVTTHERMRGCYVKARIAWTLGCRPGNVDKSPPNPVTLLLVYVVDRLP